MGPHPMRIWLPDDLLGVVVMAFTVGLPEAPKDYDEAMFVFGAGRGLIVATLIDR